MPSPDVLVLDGETSTALGIVRSLSQKGLSIVAGSSTNSGKTNFSRGIKDYFTYTYSHDHLEKAHSTILEHVKIWRPKVLMPIMNPSWNIIYNYYDDYKHLTTVMPNPGKELFYKLFDKSFLAEVSEKFSVPIPKTYKPGSIEDALLMIDELPYPVLLKPKKAIGGSGIKRVDKKKNLHTTLLEYADMPIIQEFIRGEDLELTILCVRGEPIAGSAYISLRNYPLPYGPPVACRSIKDDTFMQLGMNFLRKLSYNGVAHLDFRRDLTDGQTKLLDFNARLAGTNDISLYSGVDFGYLLYKLSIGENVEPIFEYKLGKEFRWIFGELKHLAKTPKKWRTIKDLSKWQNVTTDIFMTDPLPTIAIIADRIKRLFVK
jgi:predicted ATP-grasp superfamily ATP-dependent carboligase